MPNNYTTVAIGAARYDEEKGEYAFSAVEFNAHKGNWNFCEQVRPMPEDVKGDVQGINPPWKAWADRYWGTKWGTYSEKAYMLGGDGAPVVIEFQSAWGPPSEDCLWEIAKWMDETLGVQGVKFVGHDPYDDSVAVLAAATVATVS